MDNWSLPTSATIDGVEYEIRSDFRAVLDALSVMQDAELTDEQRAYYAFEIFYVDFDSMPSTAYAQAREFFLDFVSYGNSNKQNAPKLADWEQDFPLIVAPVNRVLGYEIRSCEYLHWWTFIGAYLEIGDCLFAQVVGIRKKKRKGKLSKEDRRFYNENRDLIDFHTKYTDAEEEFFREWAGGVPGGE